MNPAAKSRMLDQPPLLVCKNMGVREQKCLLPLTCQMNIRLMHRTLFDFYEETQRRFHRHRNSVKMRLKAIAPPDWVPTSGYTMVLK